MIVSVRRAPLPTQPSDRRDQGRVSALAALTLLLVPQFIALVSNAFSPVLADLAFVVARGLVWIGFLYLIYLGFVLARWVVIFFVLASVAYPLAVILSTDVRPAPMAAMLTAINIACLTAGSAMLLFSKKVRGFLELQGERTGAGRSSRNRLAA